MGKRSIVGEAEIVEKDSVAAPERLLSAEQRPAIPALKVRVRDDAGSLAQVFYKGEVPGHIDVGDRIRVEGHDRHGVLHAEQIYNETTGNWVTRHGRCFIAAAATGDASDEVAVLQRFRDQCLRPNAFGRWFVMAYESCAPGMAMRIRRNPRLQQVVRSGLVRPAARLARRLMGSMREAD